MWFESVLAMVSARFFMFEADVCVNKGLKKRDNIGLKLLVTHAFQEDVPEKEGFVDIRQPARDADN